MDIERKRDLDGLMMLSLFLLILAFFATLISMYDFDENTNAESQSQRSANDDSINYNQGGIAMNLLSNVTDQTVLSEQESSNAQSDSDTEVNIEAEEEATSKSIMNSNQTLSGVVSPFRKKKKGNNDIELSKKNIEEGPQSNFVNYNAKLDYAETITYRDNLIKRNIKYDAMKVFNNSVFLFEIRNKNGKGPLEMVFSQQEVCPEKDLEKAIDAFTDKITSVVPDVETTDLRNIISLYASNNKKESIQCLEKLVRSFIVHGVPESDLRIGIESASKFVNSIRLSLDTTLKNNKKYIYR